MFAQGRCIVTDSERAPKCWIALAIGHRKIFFANIRVRPTSIELKLQEYRLWTQKRSLQEKKVVYHHITVTLGGDYCKLRN